MRKTDSGLKFLCLHNELYPMTEPSITKDLNLARVWDFVNNPLRTSSPCHSQEVERGVKLTSRSSKRVSGIIRQSGTSVIIDRVQREKRINQKILRNYS